MVQPVSVVCAWSSQGQRGVGKQGYTHSWSHLGPPSANVMGRGSAQRRGLEWGRDLTMCHLHATSPSLSQAWVLLMGACPLISYSKVWEQVCVPQDLPFVGHILSPSPFSLQSERLLSLVCLCHQRSAFPSVPTRDWQLTNSSI